MPSNVGGDPGADTEPDRNDRLGGLRPPQMIEDHRSVSISPDTLTNVSIALGDN